MELVIITILEALLNIVVLCMPAILYYVWYGLRVLCTIWYKKRLIKKVKYSKSVIDE